MTNFKKQMHICYASLSYPLNGEPTSGVGTQVRLLAHALRYAGSEVSVVDLSAQPVVTKDDHGVGVHRVRVGKIHWYFSKLPIVGKTLALPVREVEYCVAVWRAVKKINQASEIDLIEGTETGMLLLALFWKRCPILIRLHGEQYTFHKHTPGMKLTIGLRLARTLQRLPLRRAKLLISPSYAHAREIQQELGMSRAPMVVVPNSVSLNGVGLNGQKRNPNMVLYAGRIEKNKGISTFLRAAAQTRRAFPEARFVFAGDFNSSLSEGEFRELVRANQLEPNVDVLGPVGTSALADLYKRSTVAVLPSHYETFGLAAIEPMAYGTPVIASDNSALPEIVLPEVNGKLIPAGDERALAAAMTELLENPKTCVQMGNAAVARAAQFDVRNVVKLTEHIYRLCGERPWTEADNHIFFSPHSDDVALSCGGAIHSLISQGRSVQVVTVFAGDSDGQPSAFARHLHQKWGMRSNAAAQRRHEDLQALRTLGVKDFSYWNYVEAPERRSAAGQMLYATYDELSGQLAAGDETLVDQIAEKILELNIRPDSSVLYFPLSLGKHVDHQILFAIGCRLSAAGKHVRFYEDYPYAEKYIDEARELNWLPQTVSIALGPKLKALSEYKSQLRGLGGSIEKAQSRLRKFSSRFGKKGGERYWEFITFSNPSQNVSSPISMTPLSLRKPKTKLGDFKRFTNTFRWHDLEEMLPVGVGTCLDVGCGDGRHKSLIESRGYQWRGVDRFSQPATIRGDASVLPIESNSQAAVVAWQVMEYVDSPEAIISDAARVLATGGIFCGSVSFLEPVHGRTFYNLSPLLLEKLLRQHGFGDIEIKPGLNGFVLMLWTWLRRTKIPLAAHFAMPLAFVMLAPVAFVLFVASWSSLQLGFGSGHFMRWISQTAPLEFAGHVMFAARKSAGRRPQLAEKQ